MIDLVADCVTALREVLPGDVEIDGERAIKIEGSGGVAIEVNYAGPWAVPKYGTARNEVLRIAIHADVSRTPFGEPVKDDADQRAYAVWLDVDRLLHDINHELHWVCSSLRSQGPTLTSVPNGDGAVLLTADYETRR